MTIINDENWQSDLGESSLNITKYYNEIRDLLASCGFKDVKIQFGWEIEFIKTTLNPEVFERRVVEVSKGIDREDKSEEYFLGGARNGDLNDRFARKKYPDGKFMVGSEFGSRIDPEPASAMNIGYEYSISLNEDGVYVENDSDKATYSQNEVVSYPLTPKGAVKWANNVIEKTVKAAPDFGLDRIDLVSKLNDNVEASGVHLNITLWGDDKNGKSCNLLKRMSFDGEEHSPHVPSDLALSIATARNEFMQEALLLYAPTNNSYRRFDNPIFGPKNGGFGERKEKGNMPSAMFRGEGKISHRVDDYKGEPDKGPFRLEERIICVEAFGHPNKSTYPEQKLHTYELIEAQLKVILEGVKKWSCKEAGESVGVLTQDNLYKDKYEIPNSKAVAQEKFLNSTLLREIYGADRLNRMAARYRDCEMKISRDYAPENEVKGAHISRAKSEPGLQLG